MSILTWEIFTVFVPIYQVITLRTMSKKTTNSVVIPNGRSMPTSLKSSPSLEWKSSSSSTLAEKGLSVESFEECYGDRLYTMDALQHVLDEDSERLQEFAALSDFSGENIAFLGEVGVWKSSWPANLDEEQVPDAFNQALGIYATFISIQDADFPLNISSQSLKELQVVFEKPTRALFGDKIVNSTSPFANNDVAPPLSDVGIRKSAILAYTGEIPAGFDMTNFDSVENHIKWLVLTNTWPKFVETLRRQSTDTERTYHLSASETSLSTWISDQRLKLKSLF